MGIRVMIKNKGMNRIGGLRLNCGTNGDGNSKGRRFNNGSKLVNELREITLAIKKKCKSCGVSVELTT